MKTKLTKTEKPMSKGEYVKLLEQHFDITSAYRSFYLDEKLPPLEKSILSYRDKYVNAYPKTVLVTLLVFGFASSVAMGTIIIWIINEIIRYRVDFSLKNILVISSVFFLAKAKLKFFDNS